MTPPSRTRVAARQVHGHFAWPARHVESPSGRVASTRDQRTERVAYSRIAPRDAARMAMVRPITDDADIRESLDHAIDAVLG